MLASVTEPAAIAKTHAPVTPLNIPTACIQALHIAPLMTGSWNHPEGLQRAKPQATSNGCSCLWRASPALCARARSYLWR
jgi:hypothetical protein